MSTSQDQPNSSSVNLGSRTVKGASWSAVSRVGQQILQVISMGILARLLGPGAYGLMAMATSFLNFLQQIGDMGTGSAVIQRDQLDDALTDSIFWFNILVGALAGALILAITPLAVLFYREPQVAPVLRTLSLTVPLTALGIVHQSLLIRHMEYRKLAIIELGTGLLASLSAVIAAWKGAGVWSLVLAAIVNTGATSILSWFLCGWRPTRHIDLKQIRSVASYSFNLSGFVVVNYFARNAGHFFVGRFLGATALGYYQLAYTLMLYPLQNITGVLGRVLFSAFARIQHDNERLSSGFVRVISVINAITAPMMLGLFITVDPLIRVFLGGKWLPLVPLVSWLAPVGLMQSVSSPVGQIYLAKGRTDLMFRVGTVSTICQVLSYIAGIPWGVQGVVISYALVNIPMFFLGTFFPFRLIGLRYRVLFASLRPAFLLSVVMTVCVAVWRFGLEGLGLHHAPTLLASTVAVGVLVYGGLMLVRKPPVVEDLLRPFAESGWPPLQRLAVRLTTATTP